jgi:Domain of unknown function (DUF4149)
MMNLLALALVVSTLTAAGVLTPPVNPSHQKPVSDQVLREGHRVIVLEYERQFSADTSAGVSNGEGGDTVKDLSGSTKDKVCDAFGVCRDKLSGAASGVEHAIKGAKDKFSQAKEVTKDKLSQAGEKVVDMMTDAKELSENKLSQAKGGIEDKVSTAKGKIGDKLANAENTLVQAKERLSEMGEEVKEKTSHLRDEMKETKAKAGDIAEETVQNLTDIARRARDVACDMVSYMASPQTSRAIWAVVQLLGFATAYGTCLWVTFISSHVLASALPRQQFGIVQSKVYPVYFRAIAYGVSITFLAQSFGRGKANMAEKLQAYNLLGALGMVVVNMFFLEPIATKVCLFQQLICFYYFVEHFLCLYITIASVNDAALIVL